MTIHARIALLRLRLEIEKAKSGHSGQARWPAGTPLGGQWKSGGGGLLGAVKQLLWGGSPGAMGMPSNLPSDFKGPPAYVYPAKGSVKHPHKDDKGRAVHIHRPKPSTPPGHWGGKDTTVTVAPGAPSPKSLNGIPFAKWNGPKDGDWSKVAGQNHELEARLGPLETHKWKYPAAGVIIKEPDGRIWLTSPTNGFGGYRNTFPKGTQEHGLSLQQTAIKEAWEETGLKVKITGVLGDFERTQSIARVYIAERVGGSPTHQGWESQAMRLVPRSAMKSMLNMPVDREITSMLWEEHDLTKTRPGLTPDQVKRLVEVIHRPLFKAKGAAAAKQGHWVNQPRWPAGTPLGGQWKTYDAEGLPKPPVIGSAANPGFQNKVNNAYASASAGNKDDAVLVLKPLELKAMQLGYNPSSGTYPSLKGLNSQQKWALQAHQYVNDLVNTGTKATVLEAKVVAASSTPKLQDYKKTGVKPGGSNPGGVYDKGGSTYLVKGANYPSDDRAKNEVLASKLMLAVGVQAPDMHLVELQGQYGGGLGVASKMETMTGWSKANAQHVEKAQSEFAVHAWLGNYDAVGLPAGDNLAMKGGDVFNYDPGGALLYRAQGLPKSLPGGMLSPSVGEWDSMRNKSVNAAAASVYGSMTQDQLKASAAKLQSISDDTIKALVKSYGPGGLAKKDVLASVLIARRDDILAKAGLTGEAPKPANVVMGSSMAGVVAAAQTLPAQAPADQVKVTYLQNQTLYHGTTAAAATAIAAGGFKPSEANALGIGVYLAKDVAETKMYGDAAVQATASGQFASFKDVEALYNHPKVKAAVIDQLAAEGVATVGLTGQKYFDVAAEVVGENPGIINATLGKIYPGIILENNGYVVVFNPANVKVMTAAVPQPVSQVVLSGSKQWMSDQTKEAYDKAADLILGKASLDKLEQKNFIAMANQLSAMGPLGNDEAEKVMIGIAKELDAIKAHPANGLGQTKAAMATLLYAAAADFGPEVPSALAPYLSSSGSFPAGAGAEAQKTPLPAQQSGLKPSFAATLTNTTEGHNKFYTVKAVGNEEQRHWGKIGTEGQTLTITHGSPTEAMQAAQATANSKLAKGYLGAKVTDLDALAQANGYANALAQSYAKQEPKVGGLIGQVHALGAYPNSPMAEAADKVVTAIAFKNQPGFDDAMKGLRATFGADYASPHSKEVGKNITDMLNQAASQNGLAMFTAAATATPPASGPGGYGSNIGTLGQIYLAQAKQHAEASVGLAGEYAVKLHDLVATAKTDADIIHALKMINDWSPKTSDLLDAKDYLKKAVAHVTVTMQATPTAAVPGRMPKLSVIALGKAPVIKGIVGAKYGVSTIGVNSAMYQGRSALLEGNLDKLNSAYAKLKEYKGKLPLGSKSAKTVLTAMSHLVDAVKNHTDLKLQSGKFVALGAAVAAAQQATDPVAERINEQSLKMLHEQTGFGGPGMLTTELGKQVVAAHAALYAGDDKALATAIGTIATSGTSSAMAITDKLTEMAEAKGGFPIASGTAVKILMDDQALDPFEHGVGIIASGTAGGDIFAVQQLATGGVGQIDPELAVPIKAAVEAMHAHDDAAYTNAIVQIMDTGLAHSDAVAVGLDELKAQYDKPGGVNVSLNLAPLPAKPQFLAGVTSDTTAYYQKQADKMDAAYSAGDMTALLGASIKKNGSPVWPVGKDGEPKTANGKLLKAHHTALVKQLAAAQTQKTEAQLDKPMPHVPEGENVGNLPAMPRFNQHMIATTNSNAASHNAKIFTIKSLAEKGDVKGLLALNYGTNTYGKKQAALANDALAAMGADFKVTPGQKKNTHFALTSTGQQVPVSQLPTGTKGPLSAALSEKDLPPKYDFHNWKGAGQGLSSKVGLNKANQDAADNLYALAMAGDVKGVQNALYADVDAAGNPTGKMLPVKDIIAGKTGSQHILNLQATILQTMDEKLHPPEPLKFFAGKNFKNTAAVAASIPPAPFGTTASKHPASQTIGYFLALGQVTDPHALLPTKTYDTTATLLAASKHDYASMSYAAQKFVGTMTGSGGKKFANPKAPGGGFSASSWHESTVAAHKYSRELPEGTTIYKWDDLTPEMKHKLNLAQPGLVIMNPAPVCASYKPTGTKGFGPSHRFKIIAAKGARAVSTFSHGGGHPGEGEWSLLPNYRLLVVDHKKNAGQGWSETTVLLLPPDPALMKEAGAPHF